MTTQLIERKAVTAAGSPVYAPTRDDITPTEPGWATPANAVGRTPWVVLDRSWARALGVRRTSGAYRIDRRQLIARLEAAESAARVSEKHGSHSVASTSVKLTPHVA